MTTVSKIIDKTTYPKSAYVDLCKKYHLTLTGTKQSLANRLYMRHVYLSKTEKRMIMPYLNAKQKKGLLDEPRKRLPR